MCHRRKFHFAFPFSSSTSVDKEIPQVKLKQTFPFLSFDDIDGRAQSSDKSQPEPKLLNSYQGHRQSITGLIFSEPNQVLISSSCDHSVRLWNLSGQVGWNLKVKSNRDIAYSFAVHRHHG